jgi:putative ABC transport system permease protein
MFTNYFKVALRNLLKNKAFSLINISGLAIGMASAILILLWVENETSFDRFHKKDGRLYEVYGNIRMDGALQSQVPTPELLGPTLKRDYPEIDQTSRVSWNENMLMAYRDKHLKPTGAWVDASFLTMFSFPLLKGDGVTALKDPYSLVVTEKLAKTIFGSEDPIGKVVRIDNSNDFKITGLLKDLPNNTSFDFEYLMSYAFLESKHYVDSDWTDVSMRTFATLQPEASLDQTNAHIKNITIKNSGKKSEVTQFLYPVNQLRLYSTFENGKPSGGRIDTVRLFSLIAAFILLIACINFMNLSTARSEKRAKEVGIRKVAGALKKSLVAQFLLESIIISFIAGLLALALVELFLPAFNQLTEKHLYIRYSNPKFWLGGIGFVLLTGILAGSYPAFFLAAFKPVVVLKGGFKKINALVTPRKILVVSQFTFAIILVISTIIIVQQIKFGQNRKSGYDKSNLAYVFIEGDIRKNYDLIRNDLLASGTAVSISQTMAPLTQSWSAGFGLTWPGKDPNIHVNFDRSTTSGNLVKTAGLTLVEGRDIDLVNYPSDSTACVINESAAKLMKFKSPIGQTIFDDPVTWHIVGVIKDFILQSPYDPTRPMIFKGPKYRCNVINIKFNTKNTTADNLAQAKKIFTKYNPSFPFEYHFVDEEYAKKFSDQQLVGKLAALFAGLTIFISCLGLFGLATYMAENRIKEVGMRKILGASVPNIAALLSKDFVKLVVVAIVIASPISWYFMHRWLMGFDYRVEISWYVFALAGAAAIFIAIITVSSQAIRAAISNPINSLRSE